MSFVMRTPKPERRFRLFKKLGDFSRDQSGLSAVEYALVAALIAGATIVSVGQVGMATSSALMGMNASITGDGANNDDGGGENGAAGGSGGSGGSAGNNGGGKSGASGSGNGNPKGKKPKKNKKGKK
jgi:Flp pilus assembly pilin Flp